MAQSIQLLKISKNIRIILITILTTAILVGGAVYIWQQVCAKNQIRQLQQQLVDLQNQIKQLHQGSKPIPILSKEILEFEEKFIEEDEREVAFLQQGNIWLLSKDLKKKYKIIDTKEAITDFSLSPDGEEIYWLNGKEIWKRDSLGNIKLLAKAREIDTEAIKKRWQGVEWVNPEEIEKLESGMENFELSPDGKYIVYEEIKDYTSCCAGPPSIPVSWLWIMKSNGSEKVSIENPPENRREIIFFDGWLPDSQKILFHFSAPDEATQGSSFYEVGADGKNPRQFAPTAFDYSEFYGGTITVVGTEPVFSPDGKKMAYLQEWWGQVWLANIDGTAKKRILESETNFLPVTAPSEILQWSEDGSFLAVRGVNKVYLFNQAGEIVFETEFKEAEEVEKVVFSPDSRYLAGVYRIKEEGRAMFFFIDLMTKEKKEFKLPEFENYISELNIQSLIFSRNNRLYYQLVSETKDSEAKDLVAQLWLLDTDTWKNYKIADGVSQVARVP